MAIHTTWWLLPVRLVILLNSCTAGGLPATPSNIECFIPCERKNCLVDIHCRWDPKPDLKIDTSYQLHWVPANSLDESITSGNSSDGIIQRDKFSSDGELHVYVEASNQHGSVRSQEIVIKAENIIRPPAPTLKSGYQDPLEIHWNTVCGDLHREIGTCDVRYQTEENRGWPWIETGLSASFAVEDPQPSTVYEFQVRCTCFQSLMSDWSEILEIKSAELAPVGEVDVWRDCGTGSNCLLTWKKLPISQARGLILGYEISLFYNDNTVKQMNVSAAESSSLSEHNGTMWLLTSSLKDVSSVSVSAYNALGATKATRLVIPAKVTEGNDGGIHLKITEKKLTVSWSLSSLFSDNLTQYVVQYKEPSPSRGFDWIKVKNSTKVTFQGTFKKYTLYQVSLFAVSNSKVYQLSTAIKYFVQGVPSAVRSFEVLSIDATYVILQWEPIPIFMQNGVILYYQIGVDTEKVYNVNVTEGHGRQTFKVEHLHPGREYKVWIRAVTVAGPGANVTTTFVTNRPENRALLLLILIAIPVILICIILFSLRYYLRKNKACPVLPQFFCEKIPDPRNSHIFRQKKHHLVESFSWTTISIYEPQPKISHVEIVERKVSAFDPDGLTKPVIKVRLLVNCQDSQMMDVVPEECERTDHRYKTGEYSKMDNSDKERDDCSSSSDDEDFSAGYEKHFMPSPLEIQEG